MAIKIESVTIERFRAFQSLTVHGLGRVNLITGKNNTGKSSFLEGLRVVATDAELGALQEMLRSREEYADPSDDPSERRATPYVFSALFHGFPDLSTKTEPLVISTTGGSYETNVSLSVSWFSRDRDSEGNLKFTERAPDDPEGSASLVITSSESIRVHRLDNLRDRWSVSSRRSSTSGIGCCFVGPTAAGEPRSLGIYGMASRSPMMRASSWMLSASLILMSPKSQSLVDTVFVDDAAPSCAPPRLQAPFRFARSATV